MTASTDTKAGHRMARGMALIAALVLVGVALQALTGGPAVQVATLRGSTGIGADPVDAVIAALALGSQVLVGYLLVMVALATVGTLPGLVGRAAGALLRQVSPVSLRRALEGLVGGALMVGVAFGPVQQGAFAASAAPVSGPVSAGVAAATPMSGPVSAGVAGAVAGGHTGSVTPASETPSPASTPVVPAATPVGHTPASDQRPSDQPPSEQESKSAAAVTSPVVAAAVAAAAAPAVTAADQPAPPDRVPAAQPVTDAAPDQVTHTVAPGDTLWDIAARHLPEDRRTNETIAAYWQQIYAANLQIVGEDPDLIHPGARLVVPPPSDQRA